MFYTLSICLLIFLVFTVNSNLKHAINSVYAVAGLVVCAKPVRILHVYQSLLFSVIYCVFSLIYQLTGGGLIYKVLDWDKMPDTIILVLPSVFLMVPALHIVVFTIYKLRVFVWKSCCRSRKVSNISGIDNSIQIGSEITSENTEAVHYRQENPSV